MKKLNPFNWASSLLIAKFLSPYFKNIDENNVNIGFWKGDITLKKLELKQDFFMLGELPLDVEGSYVEEVKLIIPWKALQTDPIVIEIKGLKLCLSQEMEPRRNLGQKETMLNELKKEALKNFDQLMMGEQNKDDGSDGGGGYLTSLINSIGENITIKIQDVELMYIFHISDKEIVKFCISIQSLDVTPCPKQMFDNSASKDIHVRKLVKISNLAIYYDTYDESFLKKFQGNNSDTLQEELNMHHYILNNTTIDIDLEVKLGEKMEIKPIINVSPILVHFNQKQIQYLLVFFEKFTELQSPRPKVRPSDKATVTIWWKYAVRRVMESENIQTKIFNMSFNTYIQAEKYKLIYMKKFINPKKVLFTESKFVDKFEEESSLAHIFHIRNIALGQIRLMNIWLRKGNTDERKKAELWFKKFDDTFTPAQLIDRALEKKKAETNDTHIKLSLHLKGFSVIIRENDIIDSLKDLQNHVHFFKSTLEDQEHLQEKVIEHIKNNFVKTLHSDMNRSWNRKTKTTEAGATQNKAMLGNYNPNLTLQDYIDQITAQDTTSQNQHKFLLGLSIEGISVDCRVDKADMVVTGEIKKIVGMDLLAANKHIKKFLEINSEIKMYYSTRIIKIMNLRGINDPSEMKQLNLVHLNIEIPAINAFLHKPFIERLGSLTEFLAFNQDKDVWTTTFNDQKTSLLYDTILRKKEKIKQQMNLSVTIQKVNVYLPTDYVKTSYMLVLHLDQLKLYKREHEDNNAKNIVAITDAKSRDEIFSQEFQPLIITIQNIRGLIVKDFQWEVIENPFRYHPQKEEKDRDKTYISTLFEILHIHLSIEKFTQTHILENKKEVFPSQQSLTIKLPLVIFNLSTKNLFVIMDLLQLWTGQTGQINLNQITGSLKKKQEDEDESDDAEDDYSKKQDQKEKDSQRTIKAKRKDHKLAKTKIIDHNISYNSHIRKVLENLVLSQIDVICEGIILHVNLEDKKFINPEDKPHHTNSILSVYLHTVSFRMLNKYFESRYSIAVKNFIIEDHVGCPERKIEEKFKAIYEELLEEQKHEKYLDENPSHHESPILLPQQQGQQTQTTKKSKAQKKELHKCEACQNTKSNLVLNFLNNYEQPDLLIHISMIDNEFINILNQDFIQTEVSILVSDLTLLVNPALFKRLRMLFDYAQLYANARYKCFVDFMKQQAFWPEINIEDEISVEVPPDTARKEDRGIALTHVRVTLPSLNLVFLHKSEPIYLANLGEITVISESFLRHSNLNFTAKFITLYNTTKTAGPHNQIISTMNGSDENAVVLNMKSLGKYQSIVKNYSTWLGIKLSSVKIVFLKRIVNEFVEYLNGQLLASFDTQLEELKKLNVPPPNQRSDMKLELAILHSVIEVFRNSISSESLLFTFKEIGLWSCGKWGVDPGHLIETGAFEEDIVEKTATDFTTEFEDAVGGDEEDADNLAAEEIYRRSQTSPNKQKSMLFSEDFYKLLIADLEVKTQKGEEDALFIRFAEDSLRLDIIFEDKTYPVQGDNFHPMKLNVRVPTLKMFAYEPDFNLLMKFFQENLGEAPQTVVSEAPPDPEWDKTIWFIVDLYAEEGLIKVFNGTREDLLGKYKKEAFTEEGFAKNFIHKNPNSLGLLVLEKIHFKMMMRKNGGKVMIVNLKQMDLYDIRHKTKIAKELRKVLSSIADQKLKFEDDATSYLEFEFEQGKKEEVDLDLKRSGMLFEKASGPKTEGTTPKKQLGLSIQQIKSEEVKKEEDEINTGAVSIKGVELKVEDKKTSCFAKIGKFFKRIVTCTCSRRKRKKEIDFPASPSGEGMPLKGNSKPGSPATAKSTGKKGHVIGDKNDSIVFNPTEDNNAFVIERERPNNQFLGQSDAPFLDILGKKVTSAGVSPANDEEVRWDKNEENDVSIEDTTGEDSKNRFVIFEESEIKPSRLKEFDVSEWDPNSEMSLYFEADPIGEKNIHISLSKKSLIVANDFLMSLVGFFKKPFTESVDPPYVRQMVYNNFPVMKLEITLNSLCVILLSKFDTIEDNEALVLFSNVTYNQEFRGDAGFGPGSSRMDIEMILKKLFFVNMSSIINQGPPQNPTKTEDSLSNFSLIDTFKINVSMFYSLAYYFNYKEVPANYEVKLELKNHQKLDNNFVLSPEQLNLIQKIVGNVTQPTMDVKEEPNAAPQVEIPNALPQVEVISTYTVRIDKMKITLIKMKQGMELAHIQLSKVVLKAIQEKDEMQMKAKITLDIEYFNRRKINFEPLLEPWEFMIKYDSKDKESMIEVCNVEPPFDPAVDLKEIHLNKNSLNLNLSSAAIETMFELVQRLTNKMKEADPYKVKNNTGYHIKFWNSRSSMAGKIISLEDEEEMSLSWNFFRQVKKKSKYISDRAKSTLDLQILKKVKGSHVEHSQDIFEEEKAISESEENLYNLIKQIDCDLMGKRFYKIKSRDGTLWNSQVKKAKGTFDFPFFTTKKVTDQSIMNLICSVHLNPKTGAKEVMLRSTALLKNNLNVPIKLKLDLNTAEVGFNDSREYLIGPEEKFYFPIEALESRTMMSFGAETFQYSDTVFDLREKLQEKLSVNIKSEEEDDASKQEEIKYKHRRDHFISCRNGHHTFNFALSIVKKRVIAAQINSQSHSEEDFCEETVFLIDPLISFTNATVRAIKPVFMTDRSSSATESTMILPGATRQFTELPYDEAQLIRLKLSNYQLTAPRKIFKKLERKNTYSLEFKPDNSNGVKSKSILFLWVEVTKTSTFSRNYVLYCPYLLINETNIPLKYQEKALRSSKPSDDPTLRIDEGLKQKTIKTRAFKHDLYSFKTYQGAVDGSPPQKIDIEAQDDVYDKIHMFSTSTKMNKLQIAPKGAQNWSKAFSLQSAGGSITLVESLKDSREREKENGGLNVVGRMAWNPMSNMLQNKKKDSHQPKRKKYEFGVNTEHAPGIFHRSKLIILTPRFAIKNETGMAIMIAQVNTEMYDDALVKIKPSCWTFFHWADHNKPFYLTMSLSDPQLQKIQGWSGRININEVGEFTVKLKQDKKETMKSKNEDDFYYARVIVSADVSNVIVRILQQDTKNPPYRIRNFTNYDICYRQKPTITSKNKKVAQDNLFPFYRVPANKSVPFAWDDLMGHKVLEIEIESTNAEYHLDKIKDYEPLRLRANNEALEERNDRNTLKKGFLARKKAFDEEYEDEYCVLSVIKQRFKLYNKKHPNMKEKISLKGARIEDMKDVRFVLSVETNKKPRIIEFRAETEEEALDWVEFIKRATFSQGPNLIHVKIDPVNSTKVITFQMIKDEKKEDNDELLKNINQKKQKYTSQTYKLSITNVIGISVIDNYPRELIHITITNLNLIQTKMNDVAGPGENGHSYIDDPQGAGGQYERENGIFTIESIVINNQLLDAQFPVVLAPNKKNKNGQPCLFVTYSSKNITYPNTESTLNYIMQFKSFLDTLEIRLDDFLISALLSMYSQIPFVEDLGLDKTVIRIYDSKPLELKLEDKIQASPFDNKRVYVKYLHLEPLDIWFTFRNSPGHKFDQNASNLLTDFGLSLVTLDSAKIKLSSLTATHIFGSTSEVIGRISKHYSRQFWTQIYKLFGSIEILGNPVSLIENLGIGVVELFYEPLHALIGGGANNPLKFGQTLAHGVKSFVSHSVTGISDTINKIIRSIASGLAAATADKDYLQQRQRQRNRTIRTIKEGFVFGLKNSLATILDAATGIFTKPCIEARRRGVFGFFKGIYIGLVSIIIKPVVGLYDLIITLIQGIKNSATYEEHIMDTRTRPPRLFSENGLVVKYDWSAATAKDLLRRLKTTKITENEEILFYDEIKISKKKGKKSLEYQVVLTDARFLYSKKYNNLEFTKIKLYKIKTVSYNKGKNQLEFNLLVPLKNNKYIITLPYQSYEKAKPLFEHFSRLKLTEEPADSKRQLGASFALEM